MSRLDYAQGVTLGRGRHSSIVEGGCFMEVVSWVAGEPWSDHPDCVPPTLSALCRMVNDRLPTGQRQSLKAHLSAMSALPEWDSAREDNVRSVLSAWVDNTADIAGGQRDSGMVVGCAVYALEQTGRAPRERWRGPLSPAGLSGLHALLSGLVSASLSPVSGADNPAVTGGGVSGQVDRWLSARATGQDTGQQAGQGSGPRRRVQAVPPGAARRARPGAAARGRRPAPARSGSTGQVLHRAR